MEIDERLRKLIQNDGTVHRLYYMSIHENWSMEKFLTEAVIFLAEQNNNLSKELMRVLELAPRPFIMNRSETIL